MGAAPTIAATLADRQPRYGDYSGVARIAQDLKDVMRSAESIPNNGAEGKAWNKLDAHAKQSLDAIADKIARILNGDPNYDDNWHDIGGYAKLSEDRVKL